MNNRYEITKLSNGESFLSNRHRRDLIIHMSGASVMREDLLQSEESSGTTVMLSTSLTSSSFPSTRDRVWDAS